MFREIPEYSRFSRFVATLDKLAESHHCLPLSPLRYEIYHPCCQAFSSLSGLRHDSVHSKRRIHTADVQINNKYTVSK